MTIFVVSPMKTDDIIKVMNEHRSIRFFKPIQPDLQIIHNAIKIAQRAPTACSGQMYSFIIINDSKILLELSERVKSSVLKRAPLAIIGCADVYRLKELVSLADGTLTMEPYTALLQATIDTSLAFQNLNLYLEAQGLGTCFIGSILSYSDEIIDLLKLPPLTLPIAGLAIGYPDENPPKRPRIATELIMHHNFYSQPTKAALIDAITYMSTLLEQEGYYKKYANKENYTWKDHLKSKFGGKWMKNIETHLKKSLQMQFKL